MISLIESPEQMKDYLTDDGDGFNIHIAGDEEGPQDVSIITSDINVGGENRGKIALVGPKRMDYDKVLSALEYLVEQINDLYNDEEEEDGRKN